MGIDPQYEDAIANSEGSGDGGWDYKQYSGPYGTKRAPGEVVSPELGYQRFQDELGQANSLVKSLGVPMTKGQEAALTSLTYNAGPKWMNSGLGAAVRAQDWDTVRQLFLQYNHAGGETNPGLTRRRMQEAAWLDEPDIDGSDQAFTLHAPKPPQQAPSAMSDQSLPQGAVDSAQTALTPTAQQANTSALANLPVAFPGVDESIANTTSNPAAPLVSKAADMMADAKDTSPASLPQSIMGDETSAPLRIQQALDMARAAMPFRSKISKSIVPSLVPEEETNMGKKTARGYADGGIADDRDNPYRLKDFSEQLRDNPRGWKNEQPPSPYEGEIRGPEDPYAGTGGPSWPARMAYSISGIPEMTEGIESAREGALEGEPSHVVEAVGKGLLGALIASRTFGTHAVPEVSDFLGKQSLSEPEDIESIMRMLGRLRGEYNDADAPDAEASAPEGTMEPANNLPPLSNADFNRPWSPTGLVRPYAEGGWVPGDRQSNNIEDRSDSLGDKAGALYDMLAQSPGKIGASLSNFLGGARQGRLPSQDDYNQLSSMMPQTAPHPYSGPAYRLPNVNPYADNDGFRADTTLTGLGGGALGQADLTKKPLAAPGSSPQSDDDVQHFAMGGPAWYAKSEARGMTHSGPLLSAVPGRTDQLPATVRAGSFVMPADVVSALGQGNTLAGNNILSAMARNPFGLPKLHGGSSIKMAKPPAMSTSTSSTVTKTKTPKLFADGGSLPSSMTHNSNPPMESDKVPVILAGGEYVFEPEEVAAFGDGDLEAGHQVLNAFAKNVRANHIKTLESLPDPKE